MPAPEGLCSYKPGAFLTSMLDIKGVKSGPLGAQIPNGVTCEVTNPVS